MSSHGLGRLIPRACCPICTEAVVVRLPDDWQDQVMAGGILDIVGCGNPWHYATAGMDTPSIEREAAAEAEALRAERDRLREALSRIAEFSNEPEAMMAADALAEALETMR